MNPWLCAVELLSTEPFYVLRDLPDSRMVTLLFEGYSPSRLGPLLCSQRAVISLCTKNTLQEKEPPWLFPLHPAPLTVLM